MKLKKDFSTIVTMVKIHLINMLDVCGLLQISPKDIDRNIILKKMKIPDLFFT